MNRIAVAVKSALGLALLVPSSMALAATAAPDDAALQEIVVTGIRQSVQASLDAKRAAVDLVDVISAEDIGKLPDKNIADSLARVPGITTSSAGANEGGFDENDRVSMRGTNPSLTQTLINGHYIASGDWFVLNEAGTVGRSVSYTLLPAEIVSQVRVEKSSSASLVEGGVAGSIDIITRKPLDFAKPFTVQASAGAVYAALPSKTDGQYSALGAWKNDANNFGVMLQLFSETRHLRRDGSEILGYETIAPGSTIALSNPDLSGVQYPALVGATEFTQKRERNGGLFDVEFKPLDDLSFDLSAFSSRLLAPNLNDNYLFFGSNVLAQGKGQAPLPGYTIAGNTLTSATFAPVAGTAYGVYDQISRPSSEATAHFVNLDTTWNTTDSLSFLGQIGYSWGDGKTPEQDVSETSPGTGAGANYQLNGLGAAPSFSFGNTDNSTPTPNGVPVPFGFIFGDQFVDVKDSEEWAKIDGNYKFQTDYFKDLKFGVRYSKHDRTSNGVVGQGPSAAAATAPYPSTFSNYPSNYDTFGGNHPSDVWFWTPAQLEAYNSPANVVRDPAVRLDFNSMYEVYEKDTAGYVQADFKGSNWAGNVGLRVVHTQEDIVNYTAVDPSTPGSTFSLFGQFIGVPISHSYTDVLPSFNLKIDVTPDLVARFDAAETMTRADYSQLAGATSLSGPVTATGTGGNPDLKPIVSNNFDAGLEWYFSKQSLLSATLFYMDLKNYVSFGSSTRDIFTFGPGLPTGGQNVTYLLSTPVNAQGRVEGAEIAYQQAFTENFGFIGNYTYADGKQTSLVTNGDDRLVGTSKNTYNVQGYFENKVFSARVAYTYRSGFFSGLDRNTAFSQEAIGTLSASLVYNINEMFSIQLDGQNLNSPILKYSAINDDQPRAFYKNGAQYFLTARFKM
ncbi:MAG TPA: TonB-dependent receptor [Steroidobacteraceae bacterium]|jgi:iron complex outermembrane receptor protein|nr:TonB-dependent receptor [Steroidobacteraceae bacterium]